MTVVYLLFVNTIAHIVSYVKLKQVKASNTKGVLAFVFINAIIALLLWQSVEWAKWLALVFPLIGGLGLLSTTILKSKGNWIDFIILILDGLIIFFILKNYIL